MSSRTTETDYQPTHAKRESQPRHRRVVKAIGAFLRKHMERGQTAEPLPLDIFEPESGSQRIENTARLTPELSSVRLDDYPPVAVADVVKMATGADLGDLMGIIKLPRFADPEYNPHEGQRMQAMTQLYIFRERSTGDRHRPRVLMMGHDQLTQIAQHNATEGRVPLPEHGIIAIEPNQYLTVGRDEEKSWLPTRMQDVRNPRMTEYPRETYTMTSREHATVAMSEAGEVYVSHYSPKGSTAVLHGELQMLSAPQDPYAAAEQADMAVRGLDRPDQLVHGGV